MLLNTYDVLASTKLTIDAMREETVPLLREIKGSVEKANHEIDRVGRCSIRRRHRRAASSG